LQAAWEEQADLGAVEVVNRCVGAGGIVLLLVVWQVVVAANVHCAVNFTLVDNPQAIRSGDRAVDNRFEDLFSANPHWLSRQLSSITRNAPELALTMLSARLLYRGEPWSRRADEAVSKRYWRDRNTLVRAAILRQLRWRKDADLAEVYARFLAAETDPQLVVSALINLRRIDADAAKGVALRLADPTSDNALPGSEVTGVRERAMAFLADPPYGVECHETVRALSWSLLRGGGEERAAAVRLLPRGALSQIAEQAAIRLIAENRRHPLSGEDAAALIVLCARLRGVDHADLASGLVELAVKAPRALASAAATALGGGVARDVQIETDGLAARAEAAGDPALHNALLELLVRLKPDVARAVAGENSPWSRLAEHREQLKTWEWEGLMK
jgi:hypothetical protein